jgi:tellurite methyltransferase
MTQEDRVRWDARYAEYDPAKGKSPHTLLIEHASLMSGGAALDVACGMGRDALWLAAHGFRIVVAADVSGVALRHVRNIARERGLAERLWCVQADLDHFRFPPAAFDLICVFRFLNRGLFPGIARSLKPGGLLIYETFNWRWLEERPDAKPDYMLRPGELLEAFGDLDVIAHAERGVRSQIVARQPIGMKPLR